MTGLRKFNLKKCFIAFVIMTMCCAITWKTEARRTSSTRITGFLTNQQDTTPLATKDSLLRDTTRRAGSLRRDTVPGGVRVDTFSLKISKDTLDGPVNYEAEDSAVVQVLSKRILLYGQTKTTYKDITLTAPLVELDQQTSMVTALSDRDSLGEIDTRARFEQGTNNFESDTI